MEPRNTRWFDVTEGGRKKTHTKLHVGDGFTKRGNKNYDVIFTLSGEKKNTLQMTFIPISSFWRNPLMQAKRLKKRHSDLALVHAFAPASHLRGVALGLIKPIGGGAAVTH